MAHVFLQHRQDGSAYEEWRYEIRDRWRRKRRGTGSKSKKETLKLAQRLEAEEEAIRKGYKPAPKPSAVPRKFESVADDYLAWGDAQGGRGGRPWGERHSMSRHRHLEWWRKELKFRMLGDLEGSLPLVESSLRKLLREGKSGRTVAMYAESLVAFCHWCVTREFLEQNPLKRLARFDTTPRSIRRALTHDEVTALLNAAPPERQILYEVALCTGLRANELRSLTGDHLDVQRCGLRLDAAWTKNRKPGFQPLPVDLVRRLVAFVKSGYASEKYERFYVRKDTQEAPKNRLLYILSNPVKAFDADLKAAGIDKDGPEGKLDFHALRVSYATFLIESGATVKEAQTLLRHSSPNLTMNTYARVRQDRLTTVTEDLAAVVFGPVARAKNGQEGAKTGHFLAPKSPPNGKNGSNGKFANLWDKWSCGKETMVEAAGIETQEIEKKGLTTDGQNPSNTGQPPEINLRLRCDNRPARERSADLRDPPTVDRLCAGVTPSAPFAPPSQIPTARTHRGNSAADFPATIQAPGT